MSIFVPLSVTLLFVSAKAARARRAGQTEAGSRELGSVQLARLTPFCLQNRAGALWLGGRAGPRELWPLRGECSGVCGLSRFCCSSGDPAQGGPGLWAWYLGWRGVSGSCGELWSGGEALRFFVTVLQVGHTETLQLCCHLPTPGSSLQCTSTHTHMHLAPGTHGPTGILSIPSPQIQGPGLAEVMPA